MKKKILSFICIIALFFSISIFNSSEVFANSEIQSIVSGEYECTWAFYEISGRWYISQLNPSSKCDVYSLGPIDPNLGWLLVGSNSAKINSAMDKITIDNGLSSNTNTNVKDEGNGKTIYYPNIISDRRKAEGKSINIAWYYFQAKNRLWYIVNDIGSESTVYKMKISGNELDWDEVTMDNYTPKIQVKNGKKYVSFINSNSYMPSIDQTYTPPTLENFDSLPNEIPKGKAYYIKGKIVSDTPITKVTVKIFSRLDNAQALNDTQSQYPNSKTYDLSIIDNDLHFTKYPAGDMEIQIWAVNSSGAHCLHKQEFRIVGNNTEYATNDVLEAIVSYAESFVNPKNKYVYGANGETNSEGGVNFDCSSFTKHVYGYYGITLPRNSTQQSKVGNKVNYTINSNNTISGLERGDLLYFESPNGGHVEIYAGNNMVVHAKGTGKGIVKEKISSWECKYIKSVRRFK